MNENLFETQHDLKSKSKLRIFYEKNKILIFSTVLIIIIIVGSFGFYSTLKEQKKTFLAESYIDAKIYLANNDKNTAKNILKEIIYANDSTYSTLSFFLILNQKLIKEQEELSNLFDYVIENNIFEKEEKNLIIFKKALFQSNFIDESELLEVLKPLINTDTAWKPHALLLLGDYFVSRKEYIKAKEFYMQILSLKNINRELYDQANSRLVLIIND
tara:strand:+ start:848 stop:1495 length:648 start_codon:yes stop_codon:yes gene_type:complete